MNQSLVEYIKFLSLRDKKDLIKKNLKLVEEVGELSKKVLPYSNAGTTTHRFTTKTEILEEIADSYLCLVSMLFDSTMNLTLEDLEEMVNHKAKKWDELQTREEGLKYPIPYEIHVTVSADSSVDEFKKVCEELKVKPIILDLDVMNDFMTSSVFFGNNGEALRELERISKGLSSSGLKVLREKIETVPWHPSAPSDKHLNPTMPKNCYFECHFAIKLAQDDLGKIDDFLNDTNPDYHRKSALHKSRNIFKKNKSDGTVTQMLTLRNYDTTYESFKSNVDLIEKDIISNDFCLDKIIVEFSIYDTKVSHDKAWLENNT